MCNEAARRIALDELRADWGEVRIPLRFPEGAPNFEPTDSIRITDPAPIIRLAGAGDAAEMVTRRWSWPGAHGRPVHNFRADGREFRNSATGGRCLIPIDGFYEFTDAPAEDTATAATDLFGSASADRPHPDPSPEGKGLKARKGRKAKWEFRLAGARWFCVAGLWRAGAAPADGAAGEAWTMLTCPPGPDIQPYHDRQIVLIRREDHARWLDGSAPAAELCRPLPAGALTVARVR